MFNQKKQEIEELKLQLVNLNIEVGKLNENINTKNILIKGESALVEEQNAKIIEKDKLIIDNKAQIAYFESIVTNEQIKADKAIKFLAQKEAELGIIEKCIEEIRSRQAKEAAEAKSNLKEIRGKIVKNEDRYNIQSYGFYEPIFKDKCSEELKEEITNVREVQKNYIRSDKFYLCTTAWSVNSSMAKGTLLIKKLAKNYITSFNLMCDAIIDRVTVANITKTKDKIIKTYQTINKQAEYYNIEFVEIYLNLKLKELDLMYSLALKKEEEKEERRIQAEMIKEQRKVEKELEKEREKLEKELHHYQNQLEHGDERIAEKIKEIKQQIEANDYRKNNSLAGYVYIIENKSFGEGIYKIGVTRRLEPLDRISELSNASVPFRFQSNCIIFSENAFKLESDLHKEFSEYRVNKVNSRKEYFKVSLDKIVEAITVKYGIAAEFNFEPEHNEWQVSSQEVIYGIDEDDDED
ncbi:DUF4041 domain-containing protein [[Clostridium] fimetarium]|uniref:Bacteriophage T5 Orf172 DNA-binding domain-containing protein n=1 Tax=[Clostridium] fimetarium TaxID=99656 RepID=A0A1I0QWN6_9FIRM|nr:DUF4041 domain-containing protein [[Clostridium] fimetarium]SEW31876.1 protein of unknown function [[Clostridium] fimetarium]